MAPGHSAVESIQRFQCKGALAYLQLSKNLSNMTSNLSVNYAYPLHNCDSEVQFKDNDSMPILCREFTKDEWCIINMSDIYKD